MFMCGKYVLFQRDLQWRVTLRTGTIFLHKKGPEAPKNDVVNIYNVFKQNITKK